MIRRRRRVWIFIAIAGVVIGAVAIGTRTLLPSWLRTTIERAGSDALGRDLRVAGAFDLSLSLTPTLVAENLTLANASWGSEPVMIRVDRVRICIDLPSLWAPPVRIEALEIDGVRVLLESEADGTGNWRFERKPSPAPPRPSGVPTQPFLVFDNAAIRDFELTYRARGDAPSVRLGIARCEARLEPATGMIHLDAAGHFNDAPWDASGNLGTIARLYDLRDVEQDVTGHIGGATIALRGRIRDPLAIGDPDLEARIEGPDIAAALATVGLRSPLTGPFRFQTRLSPSRAGVDFDLSTGIAGVTALARGHLRSILNPEKFDGRIELSGSDATVVGGWTGIAGLPAGSFDVAGRVRRDGRQFSIDDVRMRVGATTVTASGVVGEPPRCVGTNLEVAASGPDLSELSALTHVRLPPGGFAVRGRFLRRADALAVENVDIQVGETVVRGGGTIGEPPGLENLDMTVDASGKDLSWFSTIATVELPQKSFELRGRVTRRGPALDLDGFEGRLGGDTVRFHGTIVPALRLVGTDLHARVAGPDLAQAALLMGRVDVPAEPYEVSGRVLVGPEGYRFEGLEARAGRIAARIEGQLGPRPLEDGTALDFHIEGDRLSELKAWGVPTRLPDDPFRASGRVRIDGGVYRVDDVVMDIGPGRVLVDGTLGRLPDLSSLDVRVEGSGSDVSSFGAYLEAAGKELPDRLRAEPYGFSGRIRRVPAGFELEDADVALGDAKVRLSGVIGMMGKLRGTNLRFEARAPDPSLASDLVGASLPAGPIELDGGLERLESGFRLDGIALSVGEARAEISGVLGEPPALDGTDLDLRVAGPNLAAVLGPVTGSSAISSDPFQVTARLAGSVERFESPRFAARLGESDLRGTVAVTLGERAIVEADLEAGRLDLLRLFGASAAEPETTPAPAEIEHPAGRRDDRFIPDEPMALEALRSVDASVRLTADEFAIPWMTLRDAAIEVDLRNGALQVNRIEASGVGGGRATAKFSLEPRDDGYRLKALGALAGGKIDLSKTGESPERAPALDLEFEFEGEGRSLHAIAASGEGHALVTLGSGRIPANLGSFMTSGVVRGLLDAMNPFRKSSPYTDVECGIVAVEMDSGRAAVEPIAARTDKLTIIGRGRIDFDSEAIDLTWTLKPRKGVGITASSIANPYIKLGGTLSSPSIDAKPLEAVASTGAAVATAGLTVLFRGLYDRITAEKKVCTRALEEARGRRGSRDSGGGR